MTHNTLRTAKPLLILMMAAFSLFSCNKGKPVLPQPQEKMSYVDLKERELLFEKKPAYVDVNGDGIWELAFSTQRVGDPIAMQDKWQWLVLSDIFTKLPVNYDEQVPVMRQSDLIPMQDFKGYNWYLYSSIVLAQKVISMSDPDRWQGEWIEASHRFMPIQVSKNSKRYNGWVELSFDMRGEKLILHKAAISTLPETDIAAGE